MKRAFYIFATIWFAAGCGGTDSAARPDLEKISLFGFDQPDLSVTRSKSYDCMKFRFELENNDDRTYYFTSIKAADLVVGLREGDTYPFAAAWTRIHSGDQGDSWVLTLKPGERKDPNLDFCIDATTLFGLDANGDGKGFCSIAVDGVSGDPIGVEGDLRLRLEGLVLMQGFDEFGNEFGPWAPKPQFLGTNVACAGL